MDEKIDDILEDEPIVDNELSCENFSAQLADINLFCKSPYTYCSQKSIPIFEDPLIRAEEIALAKSVFGEAKAHDLELLDPTTGLSVLHSAAYFGTCSALVLAAERGANLNVGTEKGMAPLHFAVVGQRADAVKVLIERGAEVAVANYQGDTPLHLACIKHNADILESLLQRGKGDMGFESERQFLMERVFQVVNSQGNTPMSVAVLNGQVETVKLFIDIATEEIAGAGFTDMKGNTLLHLAADRGDKKMVRTLIQHCPRSIRLCARNKEGRTAFDVAHEHFFSDCCEEIKTASAKEIEKGGYDVEEDKYFTENLSLQEKELNPFKELWVHIDLKGAPPRQEFYKRLFELLQENEVTGILLEVEDMVEFTGIYSCIRRNNYYTDEQLQWIVRQAESSHMQVVPLIQCFGHLEFMLKHKEFAILREAPDSYYNLCPSHPEAVKVITGYIAQVLNKFPRAKYLHIGADEILLIGACPDCKLFLIENSRNSLYFNHVNKIIRKVKQIRDVEILIWDDMIR
eukprot:TRINITY_DN1434_c0_g2_i1.p1 TRINITY_DN1434_c0_g2~~TRINITY_DN1434_c0_g2_i1.p1  ORF type:complete len:517 (+),score=145.96 TRINITY_DN1434_c0_g2_i1:133-1683(+)